MVNQPQIGVDDDRRAGVNQLLLKRARSRVERVRVRVLLAHDAIRRWSHT